ncbi:MAG: hypothetical protein WC203_03320 [Candidatus Bathyarchaeia archaeon]|nr:hypothetical protein [Thermoproteota archaeon]MDT8782132.1 hypothetical protein [Candidatus Bathyarchaeota archaeon]NLD67151.1 hypothetical protein [Thermoproteota archaeon]
MIESKRNIYLILLTILSVGFVYRYYLVTGNIFPPGADIGLHQSVINSILSPQTDFFYNYYHMGGGLSATNPGYHIFASVIISMTGAPDYIIQGIIASFFSTLIILSGFMLVRQVWGVVLGFITAILATFSASDILMINWAGYPNIIALALIPIIFYIYLKPKAFSSKKYVTITSLIIAALFLTHIFSALVFLSITLLALFISYTFSNRANFSIKKITLHVVPLLLGLILVSPYLLNVFPVYFGSEGAITGTVPIIKQAVIETRLVSTVILALALIPLVFFFIFSKRQTGKFLSPHSILFVSATLIPLVASQCYIFGFFLDYERFLYFLSFPAIVCIGLIIAKTAEIISNVLTKNKTKSKSIKIKSILLSSLIVFCLFTPLFTLPHIGLAQTNFFQVMTPEKYEAIKWVQENTLDDSVCVAEAEFGWWLSGFGKRPTLSAVDPQYLILQREFEPALVASNLLRANYLVDNGLLQIEQQGTHSNDDAHKIYAIMDDSIIKPLVFSLNDSQISLLYRYNDVPKEIKMGDFAHINTQVVKDGNSTSFIIIRENDDFRITQEITLFQGVRFAEVTFVFQSMEVCNFDWLLIHFQSRGELIQHLNSIGIVDKTLQLINQIMLKENQFGKDALLQEHSDFYELIFNLKGQTNVKLSFYVGLCPFFGDSKDNQIEYYKEMIENNAKSYLDIVSDMPLNSFDYRMAIRQWNISYIAVSDSELNSRFSNDPIYETAFKNEQITIYKIVAPY